MSTQVSVAERLTPLVRKATAIKADDQAAIKAFGGEWYEFRKGLDQDEKRAVHELLLKFAINGKLPMAAFRRMSRMQEFVLAQAFRVGLATTGLDGGRFRWEDAKHIAGTILSGTDDRNEEQKRAARTLLAYADQKGIFGPKYGERKKARKSLENALEAALAGLDATATEENDEEEDGEDPETQIAKLETEKTAAIAAEDFARASELKAQIAELKAAIEDAKALEAAAPAPTSTPTVSVEDQVAKLETEKTTAIAAEDFARASELKAQIAELRQQQTAQATPVAVTPVAAPAATVTPTPTPAPQPVSTAPTAAEATPVPATYVERLKARGETRSALLKIGAKADAGNDSSIVTMEEYLS